MLRFRWSTPPAPPPPPPSFVDEYGIAAVAGISILVAVLLAKLFVSSGSQDPKKKRPKPLALADQLRSKLSSGSKLLEYDDPSYPEVLRGSTWQPALLKPRKTQSTKREWSLATHGTETWNKDSAGTPSAICQCAKIEDIQACVRHAATIRGSNTFCVAGGRHSHLSILDEALVCDLSLMRSVDVNAADQTVRCAGGCLNGDVNMACAPYGLGFTLGTNPGTGLGGLVLQGGHGVLERLTGLSVDSLLACDVVLADGSHVTASATSNAELFWALRGGCGNFGIVASFLFKLHPIGDKGQMARSMRVHLPFTPMVKLLGWPDRAACVRAYAEFAQQKAVQADKQLNAVCIVPAGGPVIHSIEAYYPTVAAGMAKLGSHPFATAFGKPVDSGIKEQNYFYDIGFDSYGPGGNGNLAGYYYVSGALFESLPEGAVQAIAAAGAGAPCKEAACILMMLGGAAAEVADDATAYAQRRCKFFAVIYAGFAPSADPITYQKRRDAAKGWVRTLKTNLAPFTSGAYGQLVGNVSTFATALKTEDWDHEYTAAGQPGYGWKGNLPRLAKAKAKYDPTNLFANTDNIKP